MRLVCAFLFLCGVGCHVGVFEVNVFTRKHVYKYIRISHSCVQRIVCSSRIFIYLVFWCFSFPELGLHVEPYKLRLLFVYLVGVVLFMFHFFCVSIVLFRGFGGGVW